MITLAVEVPIYAAELRHTLGTSLASGSSGGLAVNLVSHPLAFLAIAPAIYPLIGPTGSLITVESIAWLGESGLVWLWLGRRPATIAVISLLANSASLLVGLAVLN